MNGNFAPVFLQRRPKDSGLPIDGHGVLSKVHAKQAAAAAEPTGIAEHPCREMLGSSLLLCI